MAHSPMGSREGLALLAGGRVGILMCFVTVVFGQYAATICVLLGAPSFSFEQKEKV